jgi:hypothetical protein
MRYKVGDKIRIKEGLEGGQDYGDLHFNGSMEEYSGKESDIVWILDERYVLGIDNCRWRWNDSMLEDVEEVSEFSVGDIVKIVKSTGSEGKKRYIGEIHKILKDDGSLEHRYKLDDSSHYLFSNEELELVENPTTENEDFNSSHEKWFGRKYEIFYVQGKYSEPYVGEVFHAKGNLVNIDTPFTGRFFIENENGALEIIPMMGVVEMREVVKGV